FSSASFMHRLNLMFPPQFPQLDSDRSRIEWRCWVRLSYPSFNFTSSKLTWHLIHRLTHNRAHRSSVTNAASGSNRAACRSIHLITFARDKSINCGNLGFVLGDQFSPVLFQILQI